MLSHVNAVAVADSDKVSNLYLVLSQRLVAQNFMPGIACFHYHELCVCLCLMDGRYIAAQVLHTCSGRASLAVLFSKVHHTACQTRRASAPVTDSDNLTGLRLSSHK